MLYEINEMMIEIEGRSLMTFGISHPEISLYDISVDKQAVNVMIGILNAIHFPPKLLQPFVELCLEEAAYLF